MGAVVAIVLLGIVGSILFGRHLLADINKAGDPEGKHKSDLDHAADTVKNVRGYKAVRVASHRPVAIILLLVLIVVVVAAITIVDAASVQLDSFRNATQGQQSATSTGVTPQEGSTPHPAVAASPIAVVNETVNVGGQPAKFTVSRADDGGVKIKDPAENSYGPYYPLTHQQSFVYRWFFQCYPIYFVFQNNTVTFVPKAQSIGTVC